jgi:hypothetical protein
MKRLLNLPKSILFFYFLPIFILVESFNKIYFFYIEQDFIVQKAVKLIALRLMLGILLYQSQRRLILPGLLVGYRRFGTLSLSFNYYLYCLYSYQTKKFKPIEFNYNFYILFFNRISFIKGIWDRFIWDIFRDLFKRFAR